ncbi:TIGR00730 family Rossman fold protein [Nocardioides marmorisolisilvae]|uniref:Cytokinin riboside 5'-monophosphate phosphoribohydrolase n=1 Tax=Nocardioides marmorisolisilvae TaxID=1542737 RepID=A0A3N0DU44_9ACTN|nr:TIGR00730 family Rossman fold protein [Nocardioides marmorisolisilvae]RNL79016.1 TIGR00730 family Rossman fold protein [Nocardioides marmorisolisilvae]
MSAVFNVCVFSGSTPGTNPAFSAAATELGAALADAGMGLVYGGGAAGLMGDVSAGALSRGGHVTGVIPQALMDLELGRTDIADLRVVANMHERKALMYELSAAFVTLPGGLGTFDEFFETATWTKLGLHRKPCLVLDVDGYYAPLRALLDHALDSGFFTHGDQELISFHGSVDSVLAELEGLENPSG